MIHAASGVREVTAKAETSPPLPSVFNVERQLHESQIGIESTALSEWNAISGISETKWIVSPACAPAFSCGSALREREQEFEVTAASAIGTMRPTNERATFK